MMKKKTLKINQAIRGLRMLKEISIIFVISMQIVLFIPRWVDFNPSMEWYIYDISIALSFLFFVIFHLLNPKEYYTHRFSWFMIAICLLNCVTTFFDYLYFDLFDIYLTIIGIIIIFSMTILLIADLIRFVLGWLNYR